MSKNNLRKKLLILRKKNYKFISVNYLSLNYILKKNDLLKKKKIGAYYPINYEIDCLETLKKFQNFGNIISLPVTKKNNQMEFFEWSFNDPLVVGKVGAPEPYRIKKIIPDVLLVPLVSFDKYKFRIGYGGGYYDRYIEKISKIKKILTIGLAFSFQEIKRIPINNYDKKLNYILTEKNIK